MGENTAELILVIEDEIEIRELLIMLIQRQGFRVVSYSSASEVIENYNEILNENKKIDLIVLDWMLPGLNGVEFLKLFHEKTLGKHPPILMVTAKAAIQDILKGFEAGADDYITKPFEPAILIARIRALLRRSLQMQANGVPPSIYQVGALSMNIKTHEVLGGKELIHLTISEFKILQEMFKGQGKVLTRDHLVRVVQGEGVSVTDRTIDTHIFGLRKKLGSHAQWVETIRGVGYRLKYE